MKTFAIISALLFFQPFTAQAETMLDMSKSFQVASVKKLDGDKVNIRSSTQGIKAHTMGAVCVRQQFQDGSGKCNDCTGSLCKACPPYANCDGSSAFTCQSGYYKKGQVCKSIAANTTCKNGYTQYYDAQTNTAHCYQ